MKNLINTKIPKNFNAYAQIKICSNIFKNMLTLVDDNGIYPLMIGKDEIPRIWIYTKNNKGQKISIVKDNIAILPMIKVNIYSSEKKITIFTLRKDKLLEIDYSEEIPVVNNLDLRPIGYNIYGNKEELHLGVMHLKNSTLGDNEVKASIVLK